MGWVIGSPNRFLEGRVAVIQYRIEWGGGGEGGRGLRQSFL